MFAERIYKLAETISLAYSPIRHAYWHALSAKPSQRTPPGETSRRTLSANPLAYSQSLFAEPIRRAYSPSLLAEPISRADTNVQVTALIPLVAWEWARPEDARQLSIVCGALVDSPAY